MVDWARKRSSINQSLLKVCVLFAVGRSMFFLFLVEIS